MKCYDAPTVEIVLISGRDIITSSLGTETTIVDDLDGVWGFTERSD